MRRSFERRFPELWERLYPERQLIYRSRGEIRYAALSRPVQIALTFAALALIGWMGFATTQILLKDRVIAAKDDRITRMEVDYTSLTDELESAQQRFSMVTRELEAQHRQLLALVQQRDILEHKVSATSQELESVVAQRNRIRSLSNQLSARVGMLEDAFEGVFEDKTSIESVLDSTKQWVSKLTSQRDSAQRSQIELSYKVKDLEQRLANIKNSQNHLINKVQERTEEALGQLEAMIILTGLDLDALTRQDEATAQGLGGPFVGISSGPDLASVYPGMTDQFGSSVIELESHLMRWESLHRVLARLPLNPPVDSFSVASGYGKRRDPFTKRWTMHGGIDFSGVYKSTIRATAPGVVTFVGRNGPYGRMVEIDHGLGLKTRYGHLSRILVKKGARVKFRHKIGLMGSSGRSTGSHVHYEIHFKGEPRNPMKFLEAGRNVFKSEQVSDPRQK